MAFNFSIPATNGQPLQFSLEAGEILFVLGANGTGKSSLMQRLNRDHHQQARWISAHRQSWFSTDMPNMSAEAKRQTEQQIRQQDTQPYSRWRDFNPDARANIAIYDLVDAQNVRAREIANAADAKDFERVKLMSQVDSPIKVINELLKLSNLPITLSIRENDQILASKAGGAPYSVAQLSDGERNALLIGARVLTAKPNTLVLIDEPERHLHRSIISPLLTELFKKRKDCAFVVSTHDVLLPLDNHQARTLLIRACSYNENDVTAWDTNLVPSDAEIDEVLKAEILGSRKKILFVEGTDRSLDQPLYSLIFPEVSVIAKSNCRDVEHAENGIRSATNLHWLRAFGIIDSDGRQQEEIERLKQAGIYAVPSYSVESLYYHSEIQRRVIERHVAVTGENSQKQLAAARDAALKAIKEHADRMSQKVAEMAIRAEVFRNIPGKNEVAAGKPFNLTIDIAAAVSKERSQLDSAVAANNLEVLIARYPIRETPALSQIAKHLGFQDREQYESAVLKLLIDDDSAVAFIRSLFGTLATDI